MASSFVTCTANTWVKVATNVTTGMIHKVKNNPAVYLQAFVPTGDPAPSGRSAGVDAFKDSISHSTAKIENSSAVDVYIWADESAGQVRVDV